MVGIFTWNKDKWPEHEMQELIDEFRSTGEAICRWKCGAYRMFGAGDRAFISRTGQVNPGLIGSGYIISDPKPEPDFEDETKMAWYVDIRFDYLSSSSKEVVISHENLSEILGVPKKAFTPQKSGISYPGDGLELESLWKQLVSVEVMHPDAISIPPTSNRVLLKEVGKSQHKDGVRIDKAFHGIFNPPNSPLYAERGTSRKIKVDFNEKEFDAEYRFEGTKAKEVDLQRIGFFKQLREEFKEVFPIPRGTFTIRLGSNLNHFIFDYEQVTAETFNNQLEEEISKSRKDSKETRLKRLAAATKKPAIVQVTSVAYVRNPDVIVEVLDRAEGKCEACLQDAPFLRAKDKTPYLEVHHQVPLSEGGDDTVGNAIAVCPNCHRKMHYGLKLTSADYLY
jgi:predicted HNH restriction endonuclease